MIVEQIESYELILVIGETLKVFTRNPEYNRIRIELSFSAWLDNVLWVNFSKTWVKVNDNILDLLKKHNILKSYSCFWKKVRRSWSTSRL